MPASPRRPKCGSSPIAATTRCACPSWLDDAGAYLPFALDVLSFDGPRIKEVTAFIVRRAREQDDRAAFRRFPDEPADADKVVSVFERFGLPARQRR